MYFAADEEPIVKGFNQADLFRRRGGEYGGRAKRITRGEEEEEEEEEEAWLKAAIVAARV